MNTDKIIQQAEMHFGELAFEYCRQDNSKLPQEEAMELMSSGAWELSDKQAIDCMYESLHYISFKGDAKKVVAKWFKQSYGKKLPN